MIGAAAACLSLLIGPGIQEGTDGHDKADGRTDSKARTLIQLGTASAKLS